MRQRLASVISASGVCWVVSRLLHGCIAHSFQTRDINVSVRYRLTQLSFLVCLQPRIYLFVIFCFIQIMAPTKKKKVTCRSDMPRARPKRPTPARGKQTMLPVSRAVAHNGGIGGTISIQQTINVIQQHPRGTVHRPADYY